MNNFKLLLVLSLLSSSFAFADNQGGANVSPNGDGTVTIDINGTAAQNLYNSLSVQEQNANDGLKKKVAGNTTCLNSAPSRWHEGFASCSITINANGQN